MSQSKELHSTVICLQADKVLLVRKEASEWSLSGGKIDPGETQLEAARRELCEETGMRLTDAQFLGHSVLQSEEHWLYRMNVPTSVQPPPSPLKPAAASALGVLWLVTNDGTWELRR